MVISCYLRKWGNADYAGNTPNHGNIVLLGAMVTLCYPSGLDGAEKRHTRRDAVEPISLPHIYTSNPFVRAREPLPLLVPLLVACPAVALLGLSPP